MADPIKITELIEAPSDLNPESWLEVVDIEDFDEGSSGTSKKIKVKNLSSGGIGNFDASTDYSTDDVVIFNNVLYQANEAIIGDGSGFDNTKWNEIYIDRLLTSDVTLKGTSLGALETGDTITAGTLEEVINQLATKEVFINKINPSITNVSLNKSNIVEHGSEITNPVLSVNFNFGTLAKHIAEDNGSQKLATSSELDNPGSIPATSQDITVRYSLNGSPASTDETISGLQGGDSSTGTFSTISNISSVQTFEAKLDYGNGEIPYTNLENEDSDNQVLANITSISSKSITPKYKVYYGFFDTIPSNSSGFSSDIWHTKNNKKINGEAKPYLCVAIPDNHVSSIKVEEDVGFISELAVDGNTTFTRTLNSEPYTIYYWFADSGAWDPSNSYIITTTN